MATLKLLSWNIEHFGPEKIYSKVVSSIIGGRCAHPNRDALLKTIVDTAHHTGANAISFLELAGSCSTTVMDFVKERLDARFSTTTGNKWDYLIQKSNKGDVYALAYRQGQGFKPKLDRSSSAVKGCDNLAAEKEGDGRHKRLSFHSPMTKRGGRNPAWFVFETTDRTGSTRNLLFSIFTYHAMFGSADINTVGIRSVPKHKATELATFDGTDHALDKTVISGDFNCNYIDYSWAYAGARGLGAEAVSSTLGNTAKSTLVNFSWDFADTLAARAKAYDNIFSNGAITVATKGVVDMVDLLMKSKPLAASAQAFTKDAFKNGNMIKANPPETVEDAWHVYICGVSNHLPVFAEVTL